MNAGEYKVNDYSLLKVYYEDTKNTNFCVLSPRILNSDGVNEQFINISDDIVYRYDTDNNIIGVDDFSIPSLKNVVWDIGSDFFNKHINDINNDGNGLLLENQLTNYVQLGVYENSILHVDEVGCKYDLLLNKRFYSLELYLAQYYDLKNVYGIHLTVKNNSTGNTLGSYILRPEDFKITGNRLLHGGEFYLVSANIKIPHTTDTLYFQITEIKFDDINTTDNIGYIYNYTLDFNPFVGSKPFPDNIKVQLSVDESFMLQMKVVKEDYSGTLEEFIKEYFGISKNTLSNIQISYIVNYNGLSRKTGAIEEKILRVSNEYNTFDYVKIGLDINDFIDYENPSSILVNVITEIKVDDNKMYRSSNILLDFAPIVVNLSTALLQDTAITSSQILDESRVAEIIENIEIVNQQYIEKPKEIKIVQISKPVFVELVSHDFKYEKKNVYFSDITELTQLKTLEDSPQTIVSKFTSDKKCYFDLGEIIPPVENTSYELIDITSGNIVGRGTILI